jgi:hypothetical protein
VLGISGFFVWDTFLNNRSPEETVRQFYQALNRSNRARVNELVHSNSPNGNISQSQIEQLEGQVSVQSVNLINESGDRSFVSANISFGELPNSEVEIQLRKEDGEWKIYG